jgi:glycosyltransferase involved in cell wall biosynthesis
LQLCEIFKPLVNKIVVVSANGFDTLKLKSLGIKHYVIPDIENKSPKNILTISNTIKNVVKTEKITVIHTHHRMAAFYVALLGLDKCCYFISTSHNTFYNKKALTRFAYRKCNLIACGEMVKKNMTDYFELGNVTVIHNAVKPFDEDIVVEEELQKAKEEGYFLIANVGRLSEQKGMKYYIEAMPKVLEKHQKVKFYIIGDGEDKEELVELCNKLEINTGFMGFRKDVRNLMSQFDLIVLSSLWEGLPLKADNSICKQ